MMRCGPVHAGIAALALLPAACVPAFAAEEINFFSTPGSTNYTSAGPPSVLDGSFVFELGAFNAPFVPDENNTEDWSTHWVPLGQTDYDATTRWFTGSELLSSNAAPFGLGQPAYVWGYDGSGECILLKNQAWTWPNASVAIPTGVSFSVSDAGTTTIVGTVNGAGFQMMTDSVHGGSEVDPQDWLEQHFNAGERADPAISGWGADPDGDGADNLTELAAGTDPRDPASVRLPVIGFIDVDGSQHVQVELLRTAKAAIGHVLGTSGDLASWDLSGTATSVIEDSETRLLIRADDPVATAGAGFYRFFLVEP